MSLFQAGDVAIGKATGLKVLIIYDAENAQCDGEPCYVVRREGKIIVEMQDIFEQLFEKVAPDWKASI